MLKLTATVFIFLISGLIMINAQEEIPEVQCKETKEINKPKIADAYPYLSGDGLRLYFTSNREGGHGRFFMSTRNSVQEAFGKPVVLSAELIDGYYAGSLTADELTLCMVKTGSMYISTRRDLKSPFSKPVKLSGELDVYHFGPSISPDGSEIYVMQKTGERDRIGRYKRTGAFEVQYQGELHIPQGTAGPGQLSKDGLSYFFSIEIGADEYLWKYTRKSIKDPFVDLQPMKVQLKHLVNNLQPSVSADGSIIAFVTSPDERWESDDIVVVNNQKDLIEAPEHFTNTTTNADKTVQVMTKLESEIPKVYPNPFQSNIVIDLSTIPENGAVFTLYDISGRKIRQEKLTQIKTQLILGNMITGVYIYHVLDSRNRIIGSGKLVKN